jgi:hypothetical protein
LSVSKFKAIPLTPEENSTISPAWTLLSPNTLAIPSPIEITDPNSFKSFWIRIPYQLRQGGDLLFKHDGGFPD